MTWRIAIFLATLTLLASLSLSGQSPATSQARTVPEIPYARTLWRAAEGLPEDTVQTLQELPNGSLLIGTTGGLASFDGAHVVPYAPELTQATGVNSVFCLLQDRAGTLWAGTEGGGLLRIGQGKAQSFSAAQGLTDSFVRAIVEDRAGRLWVGTDDGLFRFESGRFTRVDLTAALPRLAVHSLLEDSDGTLWVGGSRLLTLQPDGTVHEFTLPGAYSENRVKKILQTADGTVWVGTVGGLQRFQEGRFSRLPGISTTVRSLLQTSDGTLWIGTIGNGLWCLRDGRLFRLPQAQLLPSETVLSILEDRRGQIWLGTQASLVRLNKTPVTVTPLPRSGDPDFETISPGPNGEVWVGAQRLYRIRDGAAHIVHLPGLEQVAIRNTLHARDGSLWVGTDGSGVYHYNGGVVQHFSAPDGLTNNFIRAFLETRSGDLWVGTDEGVNRIAPSGIARLTEANGLVYFSTRCLLEDSEGGVWVGTDRGVSRWLRGGFVANPATDALVHEKVWSMLLDSHGTLWFGTRDHGLFRYQDGTMRQFTTDQGLPFNSIYQILEDARGSFWLTGANSIASLPAEDLRGSVTSSQAGQPDRSGYGPPSVRVYSMPFGSEDAQLYGGRQPAGFIAADGSAWFPTSRGAAHVLPDTQADAGAPPRAIVEEVSADGRTQPAQSAMRFGAHLSRLSFPFSAIYLRSQKQVRFRYRLEGFDRDWTTVDAAGAATYTNLPAARYRFRLQVFDASLPNDLTEADVSFSKDPLFYQTLWFDLLCGLLLLALAWSVYWVRVRQLRARFSAVLSERMRLAREMHDTVIQGCTGISALLEAMAITPGHAAGSELLDCAREQARLTIDEARQAVWDVRHENPSGVDLVEALGAIARQIAKEYGCAVFVDSDIEAWRLSVSPAHELLMIVREAVYNAAQHSGSPAIRVKLQVTAQHLTLMVNDEGAGFDTNGGAQVDGHFGITGMRERMQRLGGEFDLNTSPQAGTSIKLHIQRRAIEAAEIGVLQ